MNFKDNFQKRVHLRLLIPTLFIFFILVSYGCDFSPNNPTPPSGEHDLTQPWTSATPAEVGFDENLLSAAVERASDISRLGSLLIVKDGRLVLEEYFHGNHADSLNDVRSVTKSIISTLVGIALKEGFINSLDETLGDYLHPDVAILDPVRQSITIRNLLTMTGGFQWPETGGPAYSDWILSGNHVQHVLDQPIVDDPGTNFNYNSGAVHLLGVLLQEAVGMPLPEFADRYLFEKIGIHQRKWENLTQGYVNGGAGIDLRPRDAARLGQLYLQNGSNGMTNILPDGWVGDVSTPRFEWRSIYGPLQSFTYGYLWWIEEGQRQRAFFAWGFGGQYIYVVPTLNLVAVTTTNWRGLTAEGGPEPLEQAVLDIIINNILPAVQ